MSERRRRKPSTSKLKTARRRSLPAKARSSQAPRARRHSVAPKRTHPPSTPETRARALQWLIDWTRRQCGISFEDDQRGLFEARLDCLSRDLDLPLEAIQAGVELGDHALTLRLADTVSTNYTFFFREPEMFDYLRYQVFPTFARAGALRIWSAAASSGEEAYSLAILAQEHLGPAATRVRILGTDISQRQLKFAERGEYRLEQLGPISESRLSSWFMPTADGQLRVRDELRAMCTFRRLNLLRRPWPFEQRFQIVFLRNVLYYFEPATRREVLDACYDVVEPNGFLITSLTEPLAADMVTRWRQLRPAVFQRGPR